MHTTNKQARQPANQPASQPASNPASQQASKPASQQASQAASQPGWITFPLPKQIPRWPQNTARPSTGTSHTTNIPQPSRDGAQDPNQACTEGMLNYFTKEPASGMQSTPHVPRSQAQWMSESSGAHVYLAECRHKRQEEMHTPGFLRPTHVMGAGRAGSLSIAIPSTAIRRTSGMKWDTGVVGNNDARKITPL